MGQSVANAVRAGNDWLGWPRNQESTISDEVVPSREIRESCYIVHCHFDAHVTAAANRPVRSGRVSTGTTPPSGSPSSMYHVCESQTRD
jgi:hypothetical protein